MARMPFLRALLVFATLTLSACSYRLMGMGAHRDVFIPHTPRAKVIAALGPPAKTVKATQMQVGSSTYHSADIHYTTKLIPESPMKIWGPAALSEMTLGLSELICVPVVATRFLPKGTHEVTTYYSSEEKLEVWQISRPGKGPETSVPQPAAP
jgi:hypothetical protein